MYEIDNIYIQRNILQDKQLSNWLLDSRLEIDEQIIANELCYYYGRNNSVFMHHFRTLITNNNFIKDESKANIILHLNRGIRKHYLAKKYYRLWVEKIRIKMYKNVNSHDLCFEDIDNNCINIYENKNRFRFEPKELTKIILNCILHNDYQIPYIKFIQNVYTRQPLTKTQLYNIYIELRIKTGKCPWLIREYALVDFDRDIMYYRHYNYLTRTAIKNTVIKSNDITFRKDAEYVLYLYLLKKYLTNRNIVDISQIETSILRNELSLVIINHYEIQYEISKEYKIRMLIMNSKIVMKFWIKFPKIIKENDGRKIYSNEFDDIEPGEYDY